MRVSLSIFMMEQNRTSTDDFMTLLNSSLVNSLTNSSVSTEIYHTYAFFVDFDRQNITDLPATMIKGRSNPYKNVVWEIITNTYNPVHRYVAETLCVLGIILNIINIIVLTRKSMIGSINFILMMMAVADILVMVTYIPTVYYTNFKGSLNFAETWTVIVLTTLTLTAHSISLWLAVVIAVFQYVGVCWPIKASYLCSKRKARIAVCTVYVVGTVCCAPICTISH